jgi:hypothetical protein
MNLKLAPKNASKAAAAAHSLLLVAKRHGA